jgi:hypothetical protein
MEEGGRGGLDYPLIERDSLSSLISNLNKKKGCKQLSGSKLILS